jgi:pSer/pThr/pTyr-binding forkhead associated (FHA) protein
VTLASATVEEVLLLLKILFLVLLYLFIWRIVRTLTRSGGVGSAQDSVMLAPASRRPAGKLVVLGSPALDTGSERLFDSATVTVGRSAENDLPLEQDEFASARHARFEPRVDGVYVEDAGSTNGTFVNGSRIAGPRRLAAGDIVRVGETDLRYET